MYFFFSTINKKKQKTNTPQYHTTSKLKVIF